MRPLTAFLFLFCFTALLSAQNKNSCAVSKSKHGFRLPAVSLVQQATENKYDVKFHHLNLDVERDTTYISGNVHTIAKVVATSLDTFGFELYPSLAIDSIRINGSLSVPARTGNYVGAPLPLVLALGGTIDAIIYYHGTPPSGATAAIGNGFSNAASGSWGNLVTWSLSESFAAYEWWPCKQSLQDKIDSSYFYITTDTANKAGSNGLLTNVVNLGNGKKRCEWKNIHMIDYYLISVAVAKYVEYDVYAHPNNCPNPVLVQNYVYDNPATLPNFKAVIDSTPACIELFSKLYGPYPFFDQKYGHCMAPFGGGMEHQTMTSLGFFDFNLIAHELSHQWFGDNVTCKTWSDIWVNEGFATYSAYLAEEYINPTLAAPEMLSEHNDIMSQPGGSIWFVDSTNTTRIFDSRLEYNKGSAMLHWIRFIINSDTVFFKVMKTYQQQFRNSTATALDFKSVLESVSGMNFTTFYNQWFYGEGFPTFSEKWNQAGNTFYLRSYETTSMPGVTPLIVTPVEYKLTRSTGDTIIRVVQSDSIDTYNLHLGGVVTNITVDPNNWIVNQVGTIVHDPNLTGISTLQVPANDVLIWPNPASDRLFVTVQLPGNYTLSVYDLNGKLVSEFMITQSRSLDIRSLAKGFYLMRLHSAVEDLKMMKLVKL